MIIKCQFFDCHDDPGFSPDEGPLSELQFTWLGALQYIHGERSLVCSYGMKFIGILFRFQCAGEINFCLRTLSEMIPYHPVPIKNFVG